MGRARTQFPGRWNCNISKEERRLAYVMRNRNRFDVDGLNIPVVSQNNRIFQNDPPPEVFIDHPLTDFY